MITIEEQQKEEILEIEKDIKRYIDDNTPENYNKVLMEDQRWEVFYHLTAMRNSVLNWYDFKEGSNVLQIGGEFGAITGMLCRKCGKVTLWEKSKFKAEAIESRCREYNNLDIHVGRIETAKLKDQFDYIIIIAALEETGEGKADKRVYADFLRIILSFLNPDGKLLLGIDNRYGLKYFCGAPEPYTGVPYAGINKYPTGSKGYSFSRQEIIDILKMAGAPSLFFYYPLPDHRLTQLVYSEEYLPGRNLKERLFFYYNNPESLTAMEKGIYEDLIDNHVFEFFANSFLIECSKGKSESKAVYAAVTTDRGEDDALATVIYEDNTVKKKPLYEKGEKRIKQVYENLMDIKARGIKIVPHSIEGGSLKMPFVKYLMFSEYLKKVGESSPEEFEQRIEQLYQIILQSSEHVDPGLNRLLCKDKSLDFGIILKRAYIDMIPLNCFISDGELIFFDQEFVQENYPALYTLFRALKYIYLFDPQINKTVSLDYLKEKYHMQNLWDVFAEEENRFVADNRKYEIYRNFYTWVWIDEARVYKNGHKLL